MKGDELFVSTEGEARGEPSMVFEYPRRGGGVGQPRAVVESSVLLYTS